MRLIVAMSIFLSGLAAQANPYFNELFHGRAPNSGLKSMDIGCRNTFYDSSEMLGVGNDGSFVLSKRSTDGRDLWTNSRLAKSVKLRKTGDGSYRLVNEAGRTVMSVVFEAGNRLATGILTSTGGRYECSIAEDLL